MGALRLRKWRLLSITTFFLLCLVLYLYSNDDVADYVYNHFPVIESKHAGEIACYDNNVVNELQEIVDDEVKKNTSMFFIETKCHSHGLNMTPRQACAVESVARLNPENDVYVLVPSSVGRASTTIPPHLRELYTYSNVKVRHVNLSTYFTQSPIESWYKSGRLKASLWPQSHASDVLRYTTLWKFGGTYMDLDIVATKSFENLTSFAGAESYEDVAAGFLSFPHGSRISNLAIYDLRDHFRGYDWGYNGPGVITRALQKLCRISRVVDMTPERCDGFKVMTPETFYAIKWRSWADFFKESESEKVMTKIKDSYAIHVWNQFSKTATITVGSSQPYGLIASKYCPKVYSSSGLEF